MKQTMILAAGLGTRLVSITENDIPKVLVPFRDSTPLDITLKKVYDSDRIVVNAYACGFVLLDHLHKNYPKVFAVLEPKLRDTGGAIKNALKWFDISSKILVINGDTLHNVNDYYAIPEVQEALQDQSYITVIAAEITEDPTGYKVFSLQNGKAVVDAGIYVVAPQAFADDNRKRFGIYDIYNRFSEYNLAKYSVVKRLMFWDIGTVDRYSKAKREYVV